MSRSRRYPPEVRERAVALVLEHQGEYRSQWAAMSAIAPKFGMATETLRNWVRQAERDQGLRAGPTSEETSRIKELERENKELRRANEILKAASAFFRAGARPADAEEMSAFIDSRREGFGVEPICKALQFAPSTYYAVKARERDPCPRALRDRELIPEIRRVHRENLSVYGAEKTWRQMRREGIEAPRCQVERLMRSEGLRGALRGGRRPRTTFPGAEDERACDLVDRDFTASAPNQLWVADFTYVSAWEATVYVAFVIDVFSRRIVGWRAARSMQTELVLDTIEMALWSRSHEGLAVGEGLIHHSDAGSQPGLNRRLIDAGVDASIGSIGDAYDNALAESAIGLFKTEMIEPNRPFRKCTDVELATLTWVDWFNHRRLHGACGDIPPVEFEANYLAELSSQ